jgi:hypothetical protein
MKIVATAVLITLIALASSSDVAHAITPPADPPTQKAPPANKPAPGAPQAKILELDWDELLPKNERDSLTLEPPPPAHGYLNESGPAAQQYGSAAVNTELNGATVKIPGFIVPLEMGKDGVVREFLLVPYFGACIHVPPPPPNQIVYVRMRTGIKLESIYDAQWITGRLKTAPFASQMGSAAYTLEGSKVEIYKY